MTNAATQPLRYVFAGDRQLAVDVLSFIIEQGYKPLGLFLPAQGSGSHSKELIQLCPHLGADRIWYGKDFSTLETVEVLRSLRLDYIFGIHFPHIVPKAVLDVPREGMLNLHPAYLPYSRGWHTSIWAMLNDTPFGATLHFMNEKLDMGDIVHQKKLAVRPEDTGDTLYKRALQLEFEVFREAWPKLCDKSYTRTPQSEHEGSFHRRKDLYQPAVQEIDLNEQLSAGDLLNRLRALTTNSLNEACYFSIDGCRYRVQVKITPEATTADI